MAAESAGNAIREALEPCPLAALSIHTAAGAGPVGEAVAWRREWQAGGYRVAEDEFTQNPELAEQWRTHPQTLAVIPLRPVEEPGEVKRRLRDRVMELETALRDAEAFVHKHYAPMIDSEQALAERIRAALTGDAQEAGR